MALTRARVVAGDAGFGPRSTVEIDAILGSPRDGQGDGRGASRCARMIEKEKPPRDIWDLKLVPGGLIDLEFIAQVAVLTGGVPSASTRPTATGEILAQLAPGFADPQVRQELVDAYSLYSGLTQITRLCLTGPLEPDDVPPGLSDLLLGQTDLPDFGVLEAHLKETAQKVRDHFGLLLRAKRG